MTTSVKKAKRRWVVAVLLAAAVSSTMFCLWFFGVIFSDDVRLFRGKPESTWIRNLTKNSDTEWRAYGEEGVQVLVRGLQLGNRPGERAYRSLYRHTPGFLTKHLPAPKADTRATVLSVLNSLAPAATNAIPAVLHIACHDQDENQRTHAIGFFINGGINWCLLRRLSFEEKQTLLPIFLRSLTSTNSTQRNNAAIALYHYPEQQRTITPPLAKAMQDSDFAVQISAAFSLNHVDPVFAKKSGALVVIANIIKQPGGISGAAVAALGEYKNEPETVVPILLTNVTSADSIASYCAIMSFKSDPPEFAPYRSNIIAALTLATNYSDMRVGLARTLLAKWESTPQSTNQHK